MSIVPHLTRRRKRRSVLIQAVDWRTYTRLLKLFADRSSPRLAYDRGTLEIMSPLFEHEVAAAMIAAFVLVLAEEQNIPAQSGGSTTLRLRKKQRGIEADRCWWVQNEARVRGKRTIDLKVDPPPDLAVEIDVTSSSLNKMGIYASLGLPEVWRGDDQGLTFQVLQPDGTYAAVTHSRAFPLVTADDLVRFLALRATLDETSVVRQFRAWVRRQLAGGPAAPAAP